MAIENDLKSLAESADRIATALENLLAQQGYVPDLTEDEVEAPAEKPSKPTKKKAAKKKTTKKKATKGETKVGKSDDEDEGEAPTKEDVRNVLKRLKDQKSHAAVKSLFRKYNASGLPTLEEKHYRAIIADAEEDLE